MLSNSWKSGFSQKSMFGSNDRRSGRPLIVLMALFCPIFAPNLSNKINIMTTIIADIDCKI